MYVFYYKGEPIYAGRVGPLSKQGIRARIRQHFNGKSGQSPLVFHIVREKLGFGIGVAGAPTQKQIAADHAALVDEAKKLVQDMEVRAVRVDCSVTQALLEIYAAVTLGCRYNDFYTH